MYGFEPLLRITQPFAKFQCVVKIFLVGTGPDAREHGEAGIQIVYGFLISQKSKVKSKKL
jgi:hypothetical protein